MFCSIFVKELTELEGFDMATPHNSAEKGQIAKTVIMPGDPLRAEYIAKTYLEDVKCFNKVRNMYGYTGKYKGVELSVMGSGMGMPSMGIYSYELYKEYDVDNIIRIGSAGSYCEELKVYDVMLATQSYSESTYAMVQGGYGKDTISSTDELNEKIREMAKKLGIHLYEGCLHSTDVFYRGQNPDYYKKLYEERKCLAVEMESFALFHNANVLNKKAACMVTISDSFVSGEVTTAEERQNSFTNMMKIALNSVI